LNAKSARAEPTPVKRLRADVLAPCRSAAERRPGRFSLTVPTGGGKTLSAMSFALNHAASNQLRRVIVVIPYTSIIEQNAKVYHDILDDPAHPEVNNVLEHHSNLDQQTLREINEPKEIRRALAAENWDAPIVVTTTDQLFESLFSNHPSRCRKLHNIAGSVIILDEVQTLPPKFRMPIIEALAELTDHYGCSVVLSTATPPALRREVDRPDGLDDVHEIIPDPVDLANRARRVNVTWSIRHPTPYDELARQMMDHRRVMAIVHRRQDARELAQHLPPEGRFHLSALMCPAHRLKVIAQIRRQLDQGDLCRVCATQLVEAGVDLDFPVVYRALAGIDSLAQAAGRCDREGRLTEASNGQPAGQFIVFRAPTEPPAGTLRKALQSTEFLLDLHHGQVDLFDPTLSETFFDELYDKESPDGANLQPERQNMNFANTAAAFRLIQNDYLRPVIVPYQNESIDAAERIAQYRQNPNYLTRRALQPLTVQISRQHHEYLQSMGAIESLDEGVDVPTPLFGNRYSDDFGLVVDLDAGIDPELCMA
jgi:CRISPR-associated endonuclease/helicase Cas3